MIRAKKKPDTTTAVWWEDLPQDLKDFIDRQFEAADERHKRQQQKRIPRKGKKAEKKTKAVVIQEDDDNADWLKRPSDLIASLDDPKIQSREELLNYLEKNGLSEILLYRRMKDDPNFW